MDLYVVTMVNVYAIIDVNVQLLRLKDLLNCVADMIKNDQISSSNKFKFCCSYYDYPEILGLIIGKKGGDKEKKEDEIINRT